MLRWRLLISAILIPALLGLFALDAQAGARAPWLLGLCLLFAVGCGCEMVLLLRRHAGAVRGPLTVLCAAAVVAAGWYEPLFTTNPDLQTGLAALGPIALATVFSVWLLLFAAVLTYREAGRTLPALGAELLIVGYVGTLLAMTAQLRWVAGAPAGYLAIGSLLVAAKAGDIFAYTIGRLVGGPKLAPRLSPGKTWAGAGGALLGAGLGAAAWLGWAPRWFDADWTPPPWPWAVLFGVVIGLIGLVGDLCESLFKRETDQKDSARLLPGFGGLLDLLDSVLYAGPVAWVLWKVLPLQTW